MKRSGSTALKTGNRRACHDHGYGQASPSQVVDLLKIWQKELAWMVEFFNRTFHKPIIDILIQFPKEDLPNTLSI
jgi:hypothetical protein